MGEQRRRADRRRLELERPGPVRRQDRPLGHVSERPQEARRSASTPRASAYAASTRNSQRGSRRRSVAALHRDQGASQGLHIDNVADAYALWWVTAWQAAHGNNDTPIRAVLGTVRQQAANAVIATGDIARASDAQKQELAEALWVQSALIDGAVEQSKGNPARLRQIGDAVRKGAKGMGLDLEAIALTSQGFVPAS
ncbi:DUF6683 family protein [Sphingomonas sp. 22176]|uniref:DUF6683 family protein n=1 Tax=Sphingomonas sp. 22176 TaxID=3453884 RepID=UPI003F86C468